MKRTISFILSLCIAVMCFAPAVTAAKETYYTLDGFTAVIDTDTKTLTVSGNGEMQDYSFYGRPVWYNLRNSFNSIIVSEGITKIGAYAFYGVTSAASVSLPSTLESIGDYAFGKCENVTDFVIPESVRHIGKYAFSDCKNTRSITFPSTLSKLSEGVLYRSSFIRTVNMPVSCPVIEDSALQSCPYVTSITLPSDLEYVGNYAFDNMSAVKTLVIPDTVKYIGNRAFALIKASDIEIPQGVEYIGHEAFYGTSWFTSLPAGINLLNGITLTYKGTPTDRISVPEGARILSHKTINSFPRVSSVSLPEGLCAMESYAIYNLASLQSITVPDSVERMEERCVGYYVDEGGAEVVMPGFTVYGHAGYESSRYAERNGMNFVCLHEPEAPVQKDCTAAEVPVFCVFCGEYMYTAEFEAGEHSFGGETTVAATCEKGGYTFVICEVCGFEKIISETPAAGHDIKYIATKVPTCMENGLMTKTCSRCSDVNETYEMLKSGHIASEWISLKESVNGKYGVRMKECIHCGEVLSVEAYRGEIILGDLDGDGKITLEDYSILTQILSGSEASEEQISAAEITGDGKIKGTDKSSLRNILVDYIE